FRPSLDYLARTIVDGGETGARLFAHLVDRTESMLAAQTEAGIVRPSSDPRMTAAIVATHGLVPLVLERVLARSLGDTGLSSALIARMTLPSLELYTHGLYADSTVLDAATAALKGTPSEGAP
ncbi:MAG: TetR/AcrR family transcriptional regulator, partial [Pseudomonas sp.]|nr:TetR/AcrR family transcriptional regulator [Pseudomonas sp.]